MYKNLPRKLALLLAVLVAGSFTSCISTGTYGPPYDSYQTRPSHSTYSYRQSAYGVRPHYNDNHYGHGHSSHYNYRKDEDRIKLTAGQQRGKSNRPTGYHSRDWYEKRGYDLDNFKHKHEDSGKTHEGSSYKKRPSTSSSSRSRSSSNSRSRSSNSRSRSSKKKR